MAGIYVHIPFCRSFCIYCDFYSELSFEESSESFLDALSGEIRSRSSWPCASEGIRTLYFGGGTPSLLSCSQFGQIMDALHGVFDLSALEEVTVEVNPDDICRKPSEWPGTLRKMGFNRVSMGVQSFDDGVLRWMNRRHDASEAVRAYEILRDAGFDNISIDLIFGFSGLDDVLWRDTIRSALSLPGGAPEHISAYSMSLEPGSALSEMNRSGRYSEPDEDDTARQYALLQSMLAGAGYEQYEVSNFSMPRKISRHNSSYWDGTPYIGFGPSAHSLTIDSQGRRVRSWNGSDLQAYLSGNSRGGYEILTDEEVSEENIMLGLRCASGASIPSSDADPLVAEGLLIPLSGGRYRIPADKFFISEYIIGRLL